MIAAVRILAYRFGRLKLLDVVYEDAELLVVNKPADLVCHPTKGDEYSSLISRARIYLGGPAHLINRLDRETTGLVVLGKNALVAGELGKLFESGVVEKRYMAIVHGCVVGSGGSIDAALGKDELSPVAVKNCVRPDGSRAQTDYEVLSRFERDERQFSVVLVIPRTGRKHQIRIHLAHLGHSIVGDKLYGTDENIYLRLVEGRLEGADRLTLILENHALHAGLLQFPWRGLSMSFEVSPHRAFGDFVEAGKLI